MPWVALSTVFLGGTVKFMVSPALGPALDLSYFQTFMANALGAIVSMVFFYYSANFFMKRHHHKQIKKQQDRLHKETNASKKKVFTRRNKLIVRLKNKIGHIPFALWAPFFLSIPIGSIITAKFFGKRKSTLWLMITGIFLNNTITVSFVYLIKNGTTPVL